MSLCILGMLDQRGSVRLHNVHPLKAAMHWVWTAGAAEGAGPDEAGPGGGQEAPGGSRRGAGSCAGDRAPRPRVVTGFQPRRQPAADGACATPQHCRERSLQLMQIRRGWNGHRSSIQVYREPAQA